MPIALKRGAMRDYLAGGYMRTALKLRNTDTGFARIYYVSENNRLYCFQESMFRGCFELLICSPDGEPSHTVSHSGVPLDKLPSEESSLTKAFVAWYVGLQQKAMADGEAMKNAAEPNGE